MQSAEADVQREKGELLAQPAGSPLSECFWEVTSLKGLEAGRKANFFIFCKVLWM